MSINCFEGVPAIRDEFKDLEHLSGEELRVRVAQRVEDLHEKLFGRLQTLKKKVGVEDKAPLQLSGTGARVKDIRDKYSKLLAVEPESIASQAPVREIGPKDPAEELKAHYFDIHWGVLMHPDMVGKVLSPLDKEDLKQEADQIEKWEVKGTQRKNFADPIHQLEEFQGQKDAKKLVGASSLNVTFNSMIQDKGLKIGWTEVTEPAEGEIGHGLEHKIYHEVPVEFIDEDGKHRSLANLSGYGRSEYKKDGARSGEIRSKGDNHTMAQVEFLDYSKNRVSDKVHFSTATYPASGALTQLQEEDKGTPGQPDFKPGWSPSIKYNTRLMSQPIIQEYAAQLSQSQDQFSEGYDPDVKNTIADNLKKKYAEEFFKDMPAGVTPDEFMKKKIAGAGFLSYDDLTESLKKGNKYGHYAIKQIQAMELFMQLDNIGAQMIRAQSTINQDVSGAGPNLLTTMSKDKTRTDLESGIGTSAEKPGILHADQMYVRKNFDPTEQGYINDTVSKLAHGIAGEFFPYREMVPMFDYVMEQTNRQELTPDTQRSIFNSMKSYIFSHPKLGLWPEAQQTRQKLMYGTESIAKRIQTAKMTWGKDDLFLQRLQPDIDPDGLRPDYVNYQASKMTTLDRDENTRHWVDMLTSDNDTKKQLGFDLVRYAYLSGGNQDSVNFIKFLPYSFLLGTDFGPRLRDLNKDIEGLITTDNFKTQYFQHNPGSAKTLSADLSETGRTYKEYPERFTLPAISVSNPEANTAKGLVVQTTDNRSGKKGPGYPEFLSYRSPDDHKWILYKKTSLFGGTEQGVNYSRIDVLGNKNIDEYSFSEGLPIRSIIPDNRSAAYDNIEPAFRALNSSMIHRHGQEVIKDLGLPREGDFKQLTSTLVNMSEDKTIADHLRTMSSFFAFMGPAGENVMHAWGHMTNKDLAGFPKLTFQVARNSDEMTKLTGQEEAGAAYNMFTGKLSVNADGVTDKSSLAELINHELIHYHSSTITTLSENDDYQIKRFKGNLDTVRFAKRIWADISSRNPELKKAIDDLHSIRMQAQNELRKDMARNGHNYDQVMNEIVSDDNLVHTNPWRDYVYATASNTEFMSHALTNLPFMRYLNGKQGEVKGMLSRIKDVVMKIMGSISRALGTDVRKNSLLDHAVEQSLNIMMLNRAATMPSAEENSNPNNLEKYLSSIASPIRNTVLTSMDRLAAKLDEQREEIVNSLTGRLLPEEYAAKRKQLDEMETDIAMLRNQQSFQIASEVGEKHLNWVDNVLKAENPTTSQIMTANRVTEVWANLIPLVYGTGESPDAPDTKFANLQARAQDQSFRLLKLSERALISISEGAVEMRDFSKITDISKDQALLRDVVSAAGSRVTQFIGSYMQTVARHVHDDVTRLVKESRGIEQSLNMDKDQKKAYYKKFLQENKKGDAWGLVQRYSQNWYDFRRQIRDERTNKLRSIEKQDLDPKSEARAKAQVWEQYWKKVNENAVYVDTRKMFGPDGGLKDDESAQKHREYLEGVLGKDHATEAIQEAHDRYRQYQDRKQAYFDHIDSETHTPEEAKKLKDEFENRYSPDAFFATREDKLGTGRYGSDYYAKMAPRKSLASNTQQETEWYDKKFEDIQNNPQDKKFYDWVNKKINDLTDMLPETVKDNLGKNFLPVVRKSLFASMLNIPEYIKTMGARTMRDLTASEYEEAANKSSYNRLPIDYIDKDQKKNPLETRSTDLPRIIEAFGMMAMHYKHFADAKDAIDLGEQIIKQIDQSRQSGTAQVEIGGKIKTINDGLKNTRDALKYMKDYILFRKSRELEGRTDAKLYSLNPKTQIETSNKVKELMKQKEELDNKFANGDIDPVEYVKSAGEIDTKLKEFGGQRIYGSKIGDKLITINQIKTLSYNPVSGFANMSFGVISNLIHANGGRDFSKSEFFKAMKLMLNSTAKWVSFGTKESAMAEKILAIMDRTGVIGDIVDSRYGKIDIRDNKAAWKHAINPWNWMRSGDYFMKGVTTMAMMMHDKVKVTEDGVEKEIPLLDAMDHEGKWNAARFGENKEWYSENVEDQKAWDKYRNKVVRVNMIIHGNQDKTSPKLANKYILGRLLGQFRMSWLPEGWYSRFQSEHHDLQLDRTVEGRYRTFGHLGIGGSIIVTLRQLYSTIGKIDPFTGVSRLDGKPLSETDRENMRRNFAELGFIAGFMAMVVTTRALAQDTDDPAYAARIRFLMNTLIRNKQDLEFYASPQVFDAVTRDVIPAMNVLKDYGKAMKATGRILFDDNYEFQQWLLSITHAGLPVPQATQINKIKYMATKDLDNTPY